MVRIGLNRFIRGTVERVAAAGFTAALCLAGLLVVPVGGHAHWGVFVFYQAAAATVDTRRRNIWA